MTEELRVRLQIEEEDKQLKMFLLILNGEHEGEKIESNHAILKMMRNSVNLKNIEFNAFLRKKGQWTYLYCKDASLSIIKEDEK